jgi:hypothetical protein
MTTTVKQLIHFLQTCDQEAEVEIIDDLGYAIDIDIDSDITYIDFRGILMVKNNISLPMIAGFRKSTMTSMH